MSTLPPSTEADLDYWRNMAGGLQVDPLNSDPAQVVIRVVCRTGEEAADYADRFRKVIPFAVTLCGIQASFILPTDLVPATCKLLEQAGLVQYENEDDSWL